MLYGLQTFKCTVRRIKGKQWMSSLESKIGTDTDNIKILRELNPNVRYDKWFQILIFPMDRLIILYDKILNLVL